MTSVRPIQVCMRLNLDDTIGTWAEQVKKKGKMLDHGKKKKNMDTLNGCNSYRNIIRIVEALVSKI